MTPGYSEMMAYSMIGSLATPLMLMLLGTFWIVAAHGSSIRRISRFRAGIKLLMGAILVPLVGVIGLFWIDMVIGSRDPFMRLLILPTIIVAPPIMLLAGFYILIDSVLPAEQERSRPIPPPPSSDPPFRG